MHTASSQSDSPSGRQLITEGDPVIDWLTVEQWEISVN